VIRVMSFLMAVAVVLAAGGVKADQNDERLDELFARLSQADDASVAREIEGDIWAIWLESGREEVDALMEEGMEAMEARLFDAAIEAFDRVVELAPGFAEGWNKRATVHYLREDFTASMADIRRTLALEPRHFGAISGMGLIFLEQRDYPSALHAFEEVLRINPHARGARERIERLRKMLYERVVTRDS